VTNVTVIPFTNEALQAVKTPYVAFEHPFTDRAARFERQLEAFVRSMAVVMLTDTWPDAYYDALNPGKARKIVDALNKPMAIADRSIWPETAIYKTDVAQLYKIDERVRYRPHMHFLCGMRDEITGHWVFECVMSPEAAITVPDRGVYELPDPPNVQMENPADVAVTGVALLDHLTTVHVDAIRSWQQQTERSKELVAVLCGAKTEDVRDLLGVADKVIEAPDDTPAQAFNHALRVARGTHIANWDVNANHGYDRLQHQLAMNVDVSHAMDDGELQLHLHSQYSGRPVRDEGSIIFNRRVFEVLGGMQPELPVCFLRDKYLHAQSVERFTFGMLRSSLATYYGEISEYGLSYCQQVANDAFKRRRTKDREFHAWSIAVRR
jgi:hypothetical protein